MANYNEGTRFNDSSAKSYFNAELKAESFKLNSDGARVKYQGVSVTSQGNLAKSKLHHVMARVMTPVTALFEKYKNQILISQEGPAGSQLHRGTDLKERIVDFTKNLKDVGRVIKEKEANIEKLTKNIEEFEGGFGGDPRSAWIRDLESEKKELNALKEEWKSVKSNVENLKEGLKDSYFGASTVLVKLDRAERKVEHALDSADKKVKHLDSTVGPKIETIKKEKQDNLSSDNKRHILGFTFEAKNLISTPWGDTASMNKLIGLLDRLKAKKQDIEAQDESDHKKENLSKVDTAITLVSNITEYKKYISRINGNAQDSRDEFAQVEKILEHCNKPEMASDRTAIAFKAQIKKDLEAVQEKLEGSGNEFLAKVNNLLLMAS